MKAVERIGGTALLDALESGEVRVAEPLSDGTWQVNAWVKEEILTIFRESSSVSMDGGFVDKEAFPVRGFQASDQVRLVPGGSAVRRGAHIASGVVLMPPCYVNVGSFVDEGCMIDSHALVGSCAQIGRRVHVSAGAQIGGVLEPVGARPVIVEDDCLIGGNCGVFEGVIVRTGAVIAAGVVLTGSTKLFDLVHGKELTARDGALEVPAGAVVVPGTRPAKGAFAHENGLFVACALIVKYRDAATEDATALEESLR